MDSSCAVLIHPLLRRPHPPPRRADPTCTVLVRLLTAWIRSAPSSSTPSPPDPTCAVLVHPSPPGPASAVLADALTGRSASAVLVDGLITGSRAWFCPVLSTGWFSVKDVDHIFQTNMLELDMLKQTGRQGSLCFHHGDAKETSDGLYL